MRVSFSTLGCKVNHYETEAMRELFLSAGYEVVPFGEPCDVTVINTCTVTATSDAKSRRLISRAHRANPDALIAVTGCYAEVSPEAAKACEGVSLVLGTDGRRGIVERVEERMRLPHDAEATVLTDMTHRRAAWKFEELSAVRDGRTRATLKIQDGCVNFCSYCIIPFARGPLRSRPMESIETELKRIASEGFCEVVLTGIHLNSYGRDLGTGETLLDVLELTKRIDGIERVRLGSLEPKAMDEAFASALAENPKLCRQFHLSLQSGSDTVLRRMNRRYSTDEYRAAVRNLRDAMPDCAITTDVIAGFQGETEAEHEETKAFLREIGFARIHVFPFSLRPGTKAEMMPDPVPEDIKNARARELISVGKTLTGAFLSRQVGTVQTVLIESDGTGYTGNYVRVRCEGNEGDLVNVRIAAIEDEIAIGEKIGKEMERMEDCLFCKIAAGVIPSKKAYEDDSVLAFYDIDPQAPVHVLIIPKRHISSALEIEADDAELLCHMFGVARKVAEELGIAKTGCRIVTNVGRDGQQSVPHLHLHLLGGRSMQWPPG